MSSLGFTSKEQRNLGLLVHLMTKNPKILYSPIGSQVDKVIQKASGKHYLWCNCMSRAVHIILTDKAVLPKANGWIMLWLRLAKFYIFFPVNKSHMQTKTNNELMPLTSVFVSKACNILSLCAMELHRWAKEPHCCTEWHVPFHTLPWTHCSLFGLCPTHTILLPEILYCINSLLKIVPNKCIIA